MELDQLYTTFDVVKIIGIKMERLQDWIKRGFIKPSSEEKVGRGIKRYFSKLDLYFIKTFQGLVENGITRQEASYIVWDVQKQPLIINALRSAGQPQDVKKLRTEPYFIVTEKGWTENNFSRTKLVYKDELQIRLTENSDSDFVHIVNLSRIKSQIDAALEE
ncbi:MerR family transcriptional regulator [uncultured Desulfosarcina sp.]|uniref:MerR family transcriptional regulator n=1 Tax=uncultured Desulfosarcina sp. TaxID=218289 RepID=UPI0029C68523|nr:MerR family transcriptional regulator [uncultured Desulfosarcina sp.]